LPFYWRHSIGLNGLGIQRLSEYPIQTSSRIECFYCMYYTNQIINYQNSNNKKCRKLEEHFTFSVDRHPRCKAASCKLCLELFAASLASLTELSHKWVFWASQDRLFIVLAN
jgi:hypothetical protein